MIIPYHLERRGPYLVKGHIMDRMGRRRTVKRLAKEVCDKRGFSRMSAST
jgi:hypothetical protein